MPASRYALSRTYPKVYTSKSLDAQGRFRPEIAPSIASPATTGAMVAADGVATGLGVAGAVGTSVSGALAAAAGLGTPAATGCALAGAAASAAGTGAAIGAGTHVYGSAAAAAGTTTASATSSVIAGAVAAADGSAVASSNRLILASATGSTSGSSTVLGIPLMTIGAVGATTGSAEATGTASITFAGVGVAAGTGTASGVKVGAITGFTRDATGAALAGATVRLYVTSTNTVFATVTSNGSGYYMFNDPANPGPFYARAYLSGSPDVAGTTRNDLIAA